MAQGFWSGRKVFVTGHTGFKGGWLCTWLKAAGARVTGFALPPDTNPSMFDSLSVNDGMTSEFGDVRDFEALRAAVTRADPETVFHMAAQAYVSRGYEEPRATYETNVLGTVNVLDAVRRQRGVKAVVIVTSDKCYENREWLWGYRETDAVGGFDPYSSSKACAELVTSCFRNSFFHADRFVDHGVGVASVRAGNTIGGGDWSADRLIPDLVRAIVAGETPQLRKPDAVRPWQHVLDVIAGYLLLAERLHADGLGFSSAWNLGPADEEARSVSWVAERFAKLWGAEVTWRREPVSPGHEAGYLKLDSSKARALLGWRPRLSLSDGLAHAVDWYKAYFAHADMRDLTLQQIEHFGRRTPA